MRLRIMWFSAYLALFAVAIEWVVFGIVLRRPILIVAPLVAVLAASIVILCWTLSGITTEDGR